LPTTGLIAILARIGQSVQVDPARAINLMRNNLHAREANAPRIIWLSTPVAKENSVKYYYPIIGRSEGKTSNRHGNSLYTRERLFRFPQPVNSENEKV